MFWAISVGIANGAMQFQLSIVGSLFIGVVLYMFTNIKLTNNPYLLVVNYKNGFDDEVMRHINSKVSKYKIKSKTVSSDNVELTLEVRVLKGNTDFVNEISDNEVISNIVLANSDFNYDF